MQQQTVERMTCALLLASKGERDTTAHTNLSAFSKAACKSTEATLKAPGPHNHQHVAPANMAGHACSMS
jgi:hypothetical protein